MNNNITEYFGDNFYYYYYSVVNYFIKIYQKWKVVGGCDYCHKFIYASDIYYQMKSHPCSLRLQYCNEECLEKSRSKHEYLKNIEFTNELDCSSKKVITDNSLLNIMKFMHKYPWVTEMNQNTPALLEHIYTLRKLRDSSSEEFTQQNKQFLDDVEQYNIA